MTVQPTPWQPVVRPPITGEPVSQAVAGRGHRDNEQRTRHLKEVIDSALAGRALILRDQVMATTTRAYQAVYLDVDNVWKPAKAEFESGSISYPAYLSRRAYAAGIVSGKDQPGLGSVCLYGEIQADSSLLAVMDGDYSPSIVYLSMMAEGNLTTARQPVSVRLGLIRGPDAAGNYRFLVQPQAKSELADHVHYKFDLYDIPAGRANCVPPYDDFMPAELEHDGPYPGLVHRVDEPDPDLPGWLPADSPVFAGILKPDGAKFGYNIDQHIELKEVWPPLPAQYAYISLNGRGLGSAQCIIDEFGIWWMDDRYGKAPWVINLSPCLSSSSLASNSSSAPGSGYPLETRDIELWFTRLVFGPGANLVSSLRPADASIAVLDLNGVASRYGNLQVKVATPVEVEDTRPRALKSWVPSTGEIGVGPGGGRSEVGEPGAGADGGCGGLRRVSPRRSQPAVRGSIGAARSRGSAGGPQQRRRRNREQRAGAYAAGRPGIPDTRQGPGGVDIPAAGELDGHASQVLVPGQDGRGPEHAGSQPELQAGSTPGWLYSRGAAVSGYRA
jgi:hypothetical protein